MKSASGRQCGERLNVSTLDLPRSFAHLPFSNYCPCVGAEGDAATATSLKVDHCHAEIVWVQQDLDFQVDPMLTRFVKDIGAQSATEVRNLVRVRDRCDLRARERRAERWNFLDEPLEASFPIDAGKFPAVHDDPFSNG
jgi:hypothetical protein